jgi:Tol biopolymer transport system component
VTQPRREIELIGFDGQVTFAEFGPDSRTIYFEAMHGVGERAIWRVDRDGGRPELIHRFASTQWFSAISLSPDAANVVYIAPAPDGHLQLFRVAVAGGEPTQITFDPSDKTHPSWSPRGDQIAFTVFRYLAHFWLLESAGHEPR